MDIDSRNNPAEDRESAKLKIMDYVEDKGRNDSLEKCTLTASQMMKVFESLHCPESKKSIFEDNVI